MNRLSKGLIVAAAQVIVVSSVGAKFLMDRAQYPRVWVLTQPYDPDLPIRGRYVRLAAVVNVGIKLAESEGTAQPVSLKARDGQLVALHDPKGKHWVRQTRCGENACWILQEPLAYFIPEHVEDPSRRPAGEELWVETTVPPTGPPRPIRLGVRSQGELRPLTR